MPSRREKGVRAARRTKRKWLETAPHSRAPRRHPPPGARCARLLAESGLDAMAGLERLERHVKAARRAITHTRDGVPLWKGSLL